MRRSSSDPQFTSILSSGIRTQAIGSLEWLLDKFPPSPVPHYTPHTASAPSGRRQRNRNPPQKPTSVELDPAAGVFEDIDGDVEFQSVNFLITAGDYRIPSQVCSAPINLLFQSAMGFGSTLSISQGGMISPMSNRSKLRPQATANRRYT